MSYVVWSEADDTGFLGPGRGSSPEEWSDGTGRPEESVGRGLGVAASETTEELRMDDLVADGIAEEQCVCRCEWIVHQVS